jgi:hypothetical protein
MSYSATYGYDVEVPITEDRTASARRFKVVLKRDYSYLTTLKEEGVVKNFQIGRGPCEIVGDGGIIYFRQRIIFSVDSKFDCEEKPRGLVALPGISA